MPRGEGRPAFAIATILIASAVLFLVLRLLQGLGEEDLDPYESPLMMSVARQLVAGPWGLYGPFDGSNPLVLIHGPLYYRAAGLLAWPMARAGLHPITAAQSAGRLISALSLLATMAGAYRLGRLGGGSRRAGWWSALLVGACPVLAGQPFAVRPDMLGVALQTWGASLSLGSFVERRRGLVGASVLFGLSVCVKQHLVSAWGVSAILAMASGLGAPARLVLPGVAVAVGIYGAEAVITGGRVWDAAIVAAANVGRVHPGDWLHVVTVVAAMVGKAPGLAAMVVAGAAFGRPGSPGWIRGLATALVGTIAMVTIAQVFLPDPQISAILPVLATAGLAIGLIGCARAGRVEAMLGAFCAAELAILVVLCRSSNGAWINYGIPAAVFASAMAARSIAVAEDRVGRAVVAMAAVAVLASVWMDAKVEVHRRIVQHGDLRRAVALAGMPTSALFFADRPGLNRMTGRLDLVFDDWLYPAFESMKLAGPRDRWLRPRIGPAAGVGAVVVESDRDRIDGLTESLPEMGFRRAGRAGRFRIWVAGSPASGAP